ncbi:hypothetical protein ACFLRF_00620 [Candidatus Altiarchaeota archaeon]
MMKVTGLGHVHSSHSHDGTYTLKELADLARKKGCSFLLTCEHAEDITQEGYQDIIEECERLSDESFIIIPGLEFMYPDYVHIIGIGLAKHPGIHPLKEQIGAIKDASGIPVLAHADSCESVPYEDLADIAGVEAWSGRYHGRFAPQRKGLEILDDLRSKTGRDVPCFSGLDLHGAREVRDIMLRMDVTRLDRESILQALGRGDFVNANRWFALGALEHPSFLKRNAFHIINSVYGAVKWFRKKTNL